jgi:hypothetical protein
MSCHPKKATEDLLNLLDGLLIYSQHHELVERGRHEYRLDKRQPPALGIMAALQVGNLSAI